MNIANKLFDQPVKIHLRVSRRNILALSKLIEMGLTEENRDMDSLLQMASLIARLDSVQGYCSEPR